MLSDYDRLFIEVLDALTGDVLPDPSWHDPKRTEQHVTQAVCKATGQTPERWDKLSQDERMPWLHATLKALEEQPAPNAWPEGDDLPTCQGQGDADSEAGPADRQTAADGTPSTPPRTEAAGQPTAPRTEAATGGRAGSAQPPLPSVSKHCRLILGVLLNRYPALLTIEGICGALRDEVSDRTIGDELNKLIADDLVARPQGQRKGATLTPTGKALAERLATGPAA
jgi:hypothetical protein